MIASLLVISIFLPLVGVACLRLLPSDRPQAARWIALAAVLVTFVTSSVVVWHCAATPVDVDQTVPGWTTTYTQHDWMQESGLSIEFSLGLDGLGIWLFGLTALLMITSVLIGWNAVSDRVIAYYSLLLLLETGMLGVFAARDLILFYVFFEATLIPLFFLIGIWGGQQRRWAAQKFFLYTLFGSVLTFLGLLAIVWWNYHHTQTLTFSIAELIAGLQAHPMDPAWQFWVFLALFAGFAIKVPLFPFHTWLPLAHVEAPTAGSILLAGVLLKIGTYGFARFSLPLLPEATAVCMPWVLVLAVIGILYGALVALAQADIKRLIAYSSVSHLGFCMLGLFALNGPGVSGSVLQMIGHGLSTGGLFAVVGMLYERYHTRQINQFGGLAGKLPLLACFMIFLTLASIGLPGLSGFAGEFTLLLGMFQRAWSGPQLADTALLRTLSVLSVIGIVLGAWYMLWLVRQMFFGRLREPLHGSEEPEAGDMSTREICSLAPLVIFIFWIGLQPQFFLERMSPTLKALSRSAESALENGGSPELARDHTTVRQQEVVRVD